MLLPVLQQAAAADTSSAENVIHAYFAYFYVEELPEAT
jgi:hypothetical protein